MAWDDRSFLHQYVFLRAPLSCFLCTRTISWKPGEWSHAICILAVFSMPLFVPLTVSDAHASHVGVCLCYVTLQVKGKELHAIKQLTIGEVGTVYLAPRAKTVQHKKRMQTNPLHLALNCSLGRGRERKRQRETCSFANIHLYHRAHDIMSTGMHFGHEAGG